MKQTDIAALLQRIEFNPNDEPPEEQVVFRIQFKRIGSLGDFILFSGRPKSGKSKYIAGCIAAAVSRTQVFDMAIKLPEHKRRVVHFDTEQSKYTHYKMMSMIMGLCQATQFPENFKSYRCRSVGPSHILLLVEHYIKIYPDTGIIFFDGLLDAVESVNDERHSSHIKQWIKRITEDYNVLLAGVIHRGFSNDKSIGHLGSDGERTAQTVLIIEKNKETKQYILRAEYMRDDDEFKPVAIHYNVQLNMWEQTDYIDEGSMQTMPKSNKRRPGEFDISEHSGNVYRIFNSEKVQSYKFLLQSIVEVYGVGWQWAKDCVIVLVAENLIWKVEKGYTNVRQGKLAIAE